MMDCMQSFSLRINQISLATSANGSIRTWGTLGQYFWSLFHKPSSATSTYNLQGFKAVNIYGVSVIGSVQGDPTSANACALVTDWTFQIVINGTPPLNSGVKTTSTDGFQLVTLGNGLNAFPMSKNNNILNLASPIQNVKSIRFEEIQVQGMGAEFLNQVSLYYDLNFVFYYKFEGE